MPQLRQAGPTPFLARLMIRLDPADRQACRAALAASGIASRLPYRLAEGAVGATCPRAQNDAESLLELPLPASLTLVQVEHIASVLAAFTSPSPPTAPAPQGQEPCATSGS